MARTTPPQIQEHLAGVDYPCTKEDLVQIARQNNAPQEIVRQLQELPDQEFQDPSEVTQLVQRR